MTEYKIIYPTVKIIKGKHPDTLATDSGDVLTDHDGEAFCAPPVDSVEPVGVKVRITSAIVKATVKLLRGGL